MKNNKNNSSSKSYRIKNRAPRKENAFRRFFCNNVGHAFINHNGWKDWIKENDDNKYSCAKCHQGQHNAKSCRNPRGLFWNTPYKPKKMVVAALTSEVDDDSCSASLPARQGEREEALHGSSSSSIHDFKALLSGDLDELASRASLL